MYSSISVHIENGKVIFDEPLLVRNNARGILTILEEKQSDNSSLKNKKIKELLAAIQSSDPFKEIENPVDWQKEIRKER